jgi:hypothetical protein
MPTAPVCPFAQSPHHRTSAAPVGVLSVGSPKHGCFSPQSSHFLLSMFTGSSGPIRAAWGDTPRSATVGRLWVPYFQSIARECNDEFQVCRTSLAPHGLAAPVPACPFAQLLHHRRCRFFPPCSDGSPKLGRFSPQPSHVRFDELRHKYCTRLDQTVGQVRASDNYGSPATWTNPVQRTSDSKPSRPAGAKRSAQP